MLQAKKSLPGIVVSLTCTASLYCALLATVSCNGTAKQDKKNADSSIIQLPGSSAISDAELAMYKTRCARWFDSVLKNRGFVGGIIVAKKGNIVFEEYCGTAHPGEADSVNANTSFHIASVSKTFTAMAVLKFWQDGKLGLDDEFSKYFPAFNYPGVTVRSLLNHRSGLPNYVYFMETLGWDKKKYIQNQDVFDYLVNRKGEIKNIAAPNTHFTYCNTNYALLALLLEKITATKFPALMQQTFFIPLQMKNTFVFDTSLVSKVIPSYDWRGTAVQFNFLDAVYGDKNVYTTVRDLFIWDKALSSGKIFNQKTLDEAFTPYSNEKPGIRNYGLGWRMNVYPNGKKMIYHNGWWHGNNASFIRLVQDSASIIVVSNKFHRGVYHAKDLAGLFGEYGNVDDDESYVSPTRIISEGESDTTQKKAARKTRIKKKRR
jgi:CubicO group peptidase (beta-lactamase class C family)